MTYVLSDSQREILGREMQPDKIDGWVNSVWNAAEERSGSGDAAVEAKIEIIESTRSRHPYDERRRRGDALILTSGINWMLSITQEFSPTKWLPKSKR